MRNHDLVFLKHFSQIIVFLVVVTASLILLGFYINGLKPVEISEAKAARVAYDGTLDGSVIYGNLCTGCHTSGAGNAPKLEKAAWTARIAQGKETLHKHAIEGYNNVGVMPARGGNPSLSDAQVIATVDWMVGNLK